MRKKRTPINESELMELMAAQPSETTPKEPLHLNAQPSLEEEPAEKSPKTRDDEQGQKRTSTSEMETYKELFFRKSETSAREGKSVYIRPEFHRRIVQIVHIIGEDNISIYNYLDNLLKMHFNQYEKEIKKAFKDQYKSIF